jgi:hypothetical protein
MSEHDRELAEAIYTELISEASVTESLDILRFPFAEDPDDRRRMWLVLQAAAAIAIDRVLARRLREAARAGPWGETVEMVEPLTGDTKIVDTRTGRIVGTQRGDYDKEDGYPWVMLPRKRTP